MDRWEEDGVMVTGSLVRGLAETDGQLMEIYAPRTTIEAIRGVFAGSV